MKLPASMQPWMAWLDQLDPVLAIQLGKLILQIEPLFPPVRTLPITGHEAFDGFNGIKNRGHYERLLSSEWMLAEDMPDEFLRRAVENEHMFLAPHLIEPRNDGTCCVIFDAGVHQLGALRVFHVAMWLVLARRAKQRGTTLRWAIAQQPARVYDDCSIAGLKHLLASRTLTPVDGGMQQQWHDYLSDPAHHAAEQWWIGAADDISTIEPNLAAGIAANRISLGDCPLTAQTTIQINAKYSQRKRLLPTPSGKLFSRLLKGKFEALQPPVADTLPSSSAATQQSLILSPCGQYVALLPRDQEVSIWRIPPAEKHIYTRVLRAPRPSQTPFVYVFDGKNLGGLIEHPDHLEGWQLPKHARLDRDNFYTEHGESTKMSAVLLRNPNQQRLYILDQQQQLHWRTAPSDSIDMRVIADQVQSFYALSPERMIYAMPVQGRMVAKCTYIRPTGDFCETMRYELTLDSAPKPIPDKILLCRNTSWESKQDTAWAAYDQETQAWWLGEDGCSSHIEVKVSKKKRVIALIQDMHGLRGLLVLQPDHRTLSLHYSTHSARTLISSAQAIRQVEVSTRHIAWIDSTQTVHLYDMGTEQMLPSIDLGG